MKKRWYRIKKEGKIGGVCAGLSEILDIDVTLIRFVWIISVFTPVPAIIAYLAAWMLVPDKGDDDKKMLLG